MTCTFFGHRDTPFSIENDLRNVIIYLIEKRNADSFYVGNHGNFDRVAIALLKKLKEQYPHIQYHIVLAYLPQNNKDDYSNTIYPEGIEKTPKRFAISFRNKWMIQQSDVVVAYINHYYGGAAQFVQMAEKKNKEIINLAK